MKKSPDFGTPFLEVLVDLANKRLFHNGLVSEELEEDWHWVGFMSPFFRLFSQLLLSESRPQVSVNCFLSFPSFTTTRLKKSFR